MELLAVLAHAKGRVVSKEALRAALWPEGFIEDGNLTQQVYLLRHALAADPRVQIETAPRRGYRLIVPAPDAAFAGRELVRHSGWIVRWASLAAAVCALAGSAGAALHIARAPLPIAAERAYQLGRLQWERRDGASLKIAETYFRRTVQLAPSDARGYAGLAMVEVIRGNYSDDKAFTRGAFGRADVFARAALARDWRNADGYSVLGLVAEMQTDGKVRAERLFRRARAFARPYASATAAWIATTFTGSRPSSAWWKGVAAGKRASSGSRRIGATSSGTRSRKESGSAA